MNKNMKFVPHFRPLKLVISITCLSLLAYWYGFPAFILGFILSIDVKFDK